MTKTLYLTRNGLLEPLGQSQVFAYLLGLSREHSITLITHEKPEDWTDLPRMKRALEECELHGIRWLPQKFRSRPNFIAPALSLLWMTWLVWREVRRGRAQLIHARSYLPAAVALVVQKLTAVPFIFDMRALWPEELITAGRLRRGSFLHGALLAIERACLRHASTVVSLTHAAVDHLKQEYENELDGQHIAVIPTCADLDRFTLTPTKRAGPVVHGCIGTILSGWFRTDWLAAWLSTVAMTDTDARFDIVTRDDAGNVRAALDPNGAIGDRLSIGPRSPQEMPGAVQDQDLSVMFYAGGEVSELGRSPTRMAEVLGCGLPVVVNEGVGDVARIVRKNRVGIILDGPEPTQIRTALLHLQELMQDPELANRCRSTAQKVFSLDAGTDAYRNIYAHLLRTENGKCAA